MMISQKSIILIENGINFDIIIINDFSFSYFNNFSYLSIFRD